MRYLLAFAISVAVSAPLFAAESGWKAGAARVVITPENLMWMSGYAARTKPAEGKQTDLWAKALVLQGPNGKKLALVTMDLVGIERGLSQRVCQELEAKHGLARESVMLSVSHTHCGPVVRSNLNVMYDLDSTHQQYVNDYAVQLQSKLVGVVAAALKNLAPAEIAWGTGYTTFATNRRNNREGDVPKLRSLGQLKGPVDHDVPVLAVRNPAGKLLAVAFGYACHATTLDFYQWSGDYPGYAQIQLERDHPDAVALFWAGCGADQNPIPRRNPELAQRYGNQLADAVEAVLNAPLRPIRGELRGAYTEVDLPFAELPTREQLIKDSADKNRYVANRAKLLLKQIESGKSLAGVYPYPIQTWQLGPDLTWVSLGGEVVVDFSLRLKKELVPGQTWVTGYANDVMAYIPSLRVLKEGGYEGGGAMVYYGQPSAWAPSVEETIVAGVKRQAAQIAK